MSDKEFLTWIYNRMIEVHGENPRVDYMLKLRELLNNQNDRKPITCITINTYVERDRKC